MAVLLAMTVWLMSETLIRIIRLVSEAEPVTLIKYSTGSGERTFCFDERRGVTTAAQAMRRALRDEVFDELGEGGIVIEAEPIRTLVSAEVNPN